LREIDPVVSSIWPNLFELKIREIRTAKKSNLVLSGFEFGSANVKDPTALSLVPFHQKATVSADSRQEDGQWIRETLTQGDDDLRLDSVQLTLRLSEVYRNVEFSPLPDSPNDKAGS
jgi:hypothetical protein